MTTTRILASLALVVALLLPTVAASAQDEATQAPAEAEATLAPVDRLAELKALMPSELAGVSVPGNLQLASGEQLMTVMRPEEAALLLKVLDAEGLTVADYTAATSLLPISESEVVVVQAHRIAGIDAADTLDTWVEILAVNLEQPVVEEGVIGGTAVTLVTDADRPEVPLLHLFSAGDVVWMVVADDDAIVEEAITAVGADRPEEAIPAE